jgi:hypothetical protein
VITERDLLDFETILDDDGCLDVEFARELIRQVRRQSEAIGRLALACRAAESCIARLTPLPNTGNTFMDEAIRQSAERADGVRDMLKTVVQEVMG